MPDLKPSNGLGDSQSREKGYDWLLEPSPPSIRYLTSTRHLGRLETAPDAREARGWIPGDPWVADIFARRNPAGWWERGYSWREPKFPGTNWTLLALADLGASRGNASRSAVDRMVPS